jgi:hypothetical protein
VANVVLVLVIVLFAWYMVALVRRRRRGIVAERGMSIGADIAALADQPRVRVRALSEAGPGRAMLVLSPEGDTQAGDAYEGVAAAPDLEVLVDLRTEDFGFRQLQEWQHSQSALAIVMPPDSHVLRLRAIDDMQPLTLRRVERGAF